MRRRWGDEFRATLRLAAPLVLAQLTQIAIYSTDVLMLGRLGAPAARCLGARGQPVLHVLFTGMGLVSACAPLIAAALGNRRQCRPRRAAKLSLGGVCRAVFSAFPPGCSCGTARRSCCCSARTRRCPRTSARVHARAAMDAAAQPPDHRLPDIASRRSAGRALRWSVTIIGLFVNALAQLDADLRPSRRFRRSGLVGSACASLITTSFMAPGARIGCHLALHRGSGASICSGGCIARTGSASPRSSASARRSP